MEEESDLLEDGEILEELEESCNTSANTNQFTQSRVTREPQTICSEESSNDNSDNSDEDSDAQCSKPKKTKPQPQLPVVRNEVPNKYKVWSLALQEETLNETMTKCDVEAIDRERSVESYNYKGVDKTDYSKFSGYHMPVSECHFLESDYVMSKDEKQYVVGSKRRRHGEKKRSKRKGDSFHPRRLPHLVVTAENSVEEVAEDIALKLRERKVDLIMNVVLVLGKEKAIALYNETKGVEDNGGFLLMNQERRRTAGGVYLLLLKRDDSIASESIKEIFASDVEKKKDKKKLHAKKKSRKSLEDIKETLIREKLLCLNTASVQDSEGKHSEVPLDLESNHLEEVELTVSNPPPSPATDQDTPPATDQDTPPSHNLGTLSDDEVVVAQSDSRVRPVVSYDDNDDYLEVDLVDDMDMF